MQKTEDFWVGDRIVRPSLGEIRLGIERIRLEPRSMEVLLALARRAREVISKQELIDEVWGEKFVSDEVLTHAIWDLRRAFGDQASNPEFIQTIPKRGYRLIAPVKEFEPKGETEGDPARPHSSRGVLFGVLGVVAVGAAAVFLGRWGSGDESIGPDQRPRLERASLSGRRPELISLALTLTPVSSSGSREISPERLDEFRSALSALPPGIEIRRQESCSPPPGDRDEYCLTPRLQRQAQGYRVSVEIKETASSRLVFSASEELTDLSGLPRAGERLAELASTYLEIVRTWDIRDPDIHPWISSRDPDVRAIRDFLHGRAMVLSHEVGGRDPLQAAIETDPKFVAPRVWRTPTLAAEGDPEALAAHQEGLRSLYDEASPFEKTMISWVEALIENKPSEQLRHLRSGLDLQPENRPVRFGLATTTYSMGDPAGAWQVLEPLLREAWCYPPIYPLAAICALDLDRVEDARRALELALQCDPVDPEGLGLLRVLAVYEDDAEAEALYAKRLDQRIVEMLPEVIEVDSSEPAEQLATKAETEGRKEIAARLREFAN